MLQCNGSGSNGSVTEVRKYYKSLLVLISQCRMLISTVLHPNCFRLFIKNTRFYLGQKLIWKDSHQYPNITTPLSLYSPSVFFMFNYQVYRNWNSSCAQSINNNTIHTFSHSGWQILHLKQHVFGCVINFGTVVKRFFKTQQEFKPDISYTRYEVPP